MKGVLVLFSALLCIVAYSEAASMYICEGNHTVLSCPKGMSIHIDFAYYGRLHDRQCKSGPILTKECRAKSSEKIVKNICENQKTCTLSANNKIFGDPCVGTHKYLHVKYCCV